MTIHNLDNRGLAYKTLHPDIVFFTHLIFLAHYFPASRFLRQFIKNCMLFPEWELFSSSPEWNKTASVYHSDLSSNMWLHSLHSNSDGTISNSARLIALGPLTLITAVISRSSRFQNTRHLSHSNFHKAIKTTTSTMSPDRPEIVPLLCLLSWPMQQ